MGVIFNGRGHQDLTNRMNALKLEAFGTSDVGLHRREILDMSPPFDRLKDPEVRTKFDSAMMTLFRDSQYVALSVQIDKQAHLQKYSVWQFHPYHYCFTNLIERYVRWLQDKSQPGKPAQGDVLAEWRGIKPNMQLERSFARLYKNGTDNVTAAEMQAHLTSGQIKIQKKEANIAGLQLADLLANPVSRWLICQRMGERMTAPFGREVMMILLKSKFRRGPKGRLFGYGLKCLP